MFLILNKGLNLGFQILSDSEIIAELNNVIKNEIQIQKNQIK